MISLHPDRFFSPDPSQRIVARELYASIKALPLICPHGHVDPGIFIDPDFHFSSPTDLLIIPDHYVYRMLYSQGIPLEALGIPSSKSTIQSQTDPRAIWQLFADHFHLFSGTPTGIWLNDEFENVFGINEKLTSSNAQTVYNEINTRLSSTDFTPRALFEQFNIEVLCTTDAATDSLDAHRSISESGWTARILPTFRPDAVIKIDTPGWRDNITRLEAVTGTTITSYPGFILALEKQREHFKSMGARATDHDAQTAFTIELSPDEANSIFTQALRGGTGTNEAKLFTGHMLVEMARMSTEDGLVMQLHTGSYRNHNPLIFNQFGGDKGADIPISNEFTRNLKPVLDKFGNHPTLKLILFTLDESTYSRELAPLVGHYPILRLGPPWWFLDSLNGIRRYFDQVMETAGIYNTAGFNDDTRAFPSIPARHDIWRRAASDWVAGLLVRHIIDDQDAYRMIKELAYDLARSTYNLDKD